MTYKQCLFSLVSLFFLSGCGSYVEKGPQPQNQAQVSFVPSTQESIVLKELAERCERDTSCRSGLCADPGFGFQVCTSECGTFRPCGKGFSCANGLCVPSCQKDGDCSTYSELPTCGGGGVCWR